MAVTVTISAHNDNSGTIANRLAARLEREPSNAELVAEVKRIMRGEPVAMVPLPCQQQQAKAGGGRLWDGVENFAGDATALQIDGEDRVHVSLVRDPAGELPDADWIRWQSVIAAAPAMLAALKAFAEPGQPVSAHVIKQARAAIRQAEGVA